MPNRCPESASSLQNHSIFGIRALFSGSRLKASRWLALGMGLLLLWAMGPAAAQVYHWKSQTYVGGVEVRTGTELTGPALSTSDAYGRLGEQTGELSLQLATGSREQNAIRAADALAALRMAVGLTPQAGGDPASPFQYWAADVNGDGRVTAADALEILRQAVRSPEAVEKRWVFVPEALATDSSAPITRQQVPNPGAVQAGQAVVAVLVGDVLGTWVPPTEAIAVGTAPPPINDGSGGDLVSPDPDPAPAIPLLAFDLRGAVSLQALDQTIEALPSAAGRMRGERDSGAPGLLQYRIANEGLSEVSAAAAARLQPRSNAQAPSNLLAVDSEGNARLAAQSRFPMKVLYSALAPDGLHVYIALETRWLNDGNDYTRLVAETNCALYQVRLSDNSQRCVQEGVFVQPIDQRYRETISGDQKPLQFDSEGRLHYAATAFTRQCSTSTNGVQTCSLQTRNWNPRIYRQETSGTVTALTPDNLSIDFFLVLPTGEVVYRSRVGEEPATLRMRQREGTLNISGDWPVDYFTTDTHQSILFGAWDTSGVRIARPRSSGVGVERVILNPWPSLTPRRLLVGDDGRLYGVLETADRGRLEIQSVLPHDPTPLVNIPLASGGWWARMQRTPFQVARGFLFYREMEDVPFLGSRDVIRMVRLDDPQQQYLALDGEGSRYELTAWQLRGNTLSFSALDLTRSVTVFGEIDVLQLRQGKTEDEYLVLQEMTSALGAAAVVRDIESLRPVVPPSDPGMAPRVSFLMQADNPYTISLDFTKYMNHALVEEGLQLREAGGEDIAAMRVWIYQSLHLIPDLTGLGNTETRSLDSSKRYELTLAAAIEDQYRWLLTGTREATWPPETSSRLVQLNAQAGTGGRIDPSETWIQRGTSTTFTLSVDAGYQLLSVEGCNGSLQGMRYTTGNVTADCSVQALFTVQPVTRYTLTFDSAGGSAVSAITGEAGAAVTAPSNPTRAGYTFAGWNPAIPTTMPTENRTFTAQWQRIAHPISGDNECEMLATTRISFELENSCERVGIDCARINYLTKNLTDSLIKLIDIEAEVSILDTGVMYSFGPMFNEEKREQSQESLELFSSLNHREQDDLAVQILWLGDKVGTPTVFLNPGEATEDYEERPCCGYSARSGLLRAVTLSNLSAGQDAIFRYRYVDEYGERINAQCQTEWDGKIHLKLPDNQPINQFTLTFDSAGGSSVSAITGEAGAAVTAPSNPTRAGYTFAGWNPAIPTTMPTENRTFTAQWESLGGSGTGGLIAGRYEILGADGGIVRDVETGLEWMRCSVGQTWSSSTQSCTGTASLHTIDESQAIVAAANVAGGDGDHIEWRLPSIEELRTIVYCSSGQPTYFKNDESSCSGSYSSPTIQSVVFPDTPSARYWSDSSGMGHAWSVFFGNGGAYNMVGGTFERGTSYIRLVRGEQKLLSSWVVQAGGPHWDSVRSIATFPDGSSIITGGFQRTAQFGPFTLDAPGGSAFIAKLDPSGKFLWAKQPELVDTPQSRFQGRGIASFEDGSSIVTGGFDAEVFIYKLDPKGNFVWANQSKGGATSEKVATLPNGSSIVTGTFRDTVSFGEVKLFTEDSNAVFITKLDPDGNFVWAKQSVSRLSSNVNDITINVNDITILPDKSSLIIGYFSGLVNFGTHTLVADGQLANVFVVKLDENGEFLWAQQSNGLYDSIGKSISAFPDGSSIITGYFNDIVRFGDLHLLSSAGENGRDLFVVKIDKNGFFKWATQSKASDSSGSSQNTADGLGVVSLKDGGAIVVGKSKGTVQFGNEDFYNPGSSAVVFKVDEYGMFDWVKRISGISGRSMSFSAVAYPNNGSFISAGSFIRTNLCGQELRSLASESGSENPDIFILKLPLNGTCDLHH